MIEDALQQQLKNLEWMIPDAQRRVAKQLRQWLDAHRKR